jgi:hypothetical protein
LQFLADAHHPPDAALRAVLRSSLWRWLGLAPLVALAVWWSAMATPFTVMGWAALLALLQLAWYLAQPWTLRTASPLSAALVRAAPPVVALLLTVTVARAWPAESPHGLLLAAACGYAVGALWLRSARLEGHTPTHQAAKYKPQYLKHIGRAKPRHASVNTHLNRSGYTSFKRYLLWLVVFFVLSVNVIEKLNKCLVKLFLKLRFLFTLFSKIPVWVYKQFCLSS